AKTGQVYLNDTGYSLPDLTEKLRAIAVTRRDQPIYVRADQAVPYGQVMRTMAAVRQAGIVRVGLGTGAAPAPRQPWRPCCLSIPSGVTTSPWASASRRCST